MLDNRLSIADTNTRYGLITEQKKGSYKYFFDVGDSMVVSTMRTSYVDEVRWHQT